jgi:hypothetical protein
MRFLVLLSLVVILAGCKPHADNELPRGLAKDSVIPRPEMIHILVDVHILEAALQIQRNKNADPGVLENYYYQQLFSRYKISKKKFEKNLSWYESDPEKFRKMYEEVISKLDTLQKHSSSGKIKPPSR